MSVARATPLRAVLVPHATVQQLGGIPSELALTPQPFQLSPLGGDTLPAPPLPSAVYYLANATPVTLGGVPIPAGSVLGQTLRLSCQTAAVVVPADPLIQGSPFTIRPGADITLSWGGSSWAVSGGGEYSAAILNYTPAVPADWLVTPSTGKAALDELAARISDPEAVLASRDQDVSTNVTVGAPPAFANSQVYLSGSRSLRAGTHRVIAAVLVSMSSSSQFLIDVWNNGSAIIPDSYAAFSLANSGARVWHVSQIPLTLLSDQVVNLSIVVGKFGGTGAATFKQAVLAVESPL